MGKSLKANSSFELCAGKKVHIPPLKQFQVQSLAGDKFEFVEKIVEKNEDLKELNDKWILGGQDSCHVSCYACLLETTDKHFFVLRHY